ncbi:MAG: DUF389 domain-containing protein [Muriicola sp.]|nr:DUF389 domain-containing protein [Muriicola sp.]NNK20826.1 DUF389 domain-containing protein [Flavobacteriaceae bacterium]NNK35096.1 DUF389 domain-containing protein [Eudoraea sp.]
MDTGNDPNKDIDLEGVEEVKKEIKGALGSTKQFLRELLDIRKNTDRESTKEAIIADIPFKGHTAWILVCSIFIASIGLNANSTAVVIGAMLISPLMGPILGIGLSLAVNDIDTLKRALRNFTVMVVLSVLTAYLFFEFFPLRDESSELLARTKPDIRDVLIAFFGGLALVIARAKKGTVASVIFGVAIATALMPPLCTVGFGLAIGNFAFAGGAMYLFMINTIFIGLATFLVLKLLRFPMVKYANSTKRRFIARIASLVAILVMIPAGFTFYNVFQESRFMNQANDLIHNTIDLYQFKNRGRFMNNLTIIDYNPNGISTIELVTMGDESIPENVIATWENQMASYSKLQNTELKILQGGQDDSEQMLNYVNELYEAKKSELLSKDERIRLLEQELTELSSFARKQIPFTDISAEAQSQYENLEKLSFSYMVTTDFKSLDTIPVFEVKWKEGIQIDQLNTDLKKLNEWLKIRLKDSKVLVKVSQD